MSLQPGVFISYAVIDVWCIILNSNERLRSPNSPKRFFATTNPCVTYILHIILIHRKYMYSFHFMLSKSDIVALIF